MGITVVDVGDAVVVSGILRDDDRSSNPDGVPIPLSAITAIALTLRDAESGAIINDREEQDVLNANGGEMSATGGGFRWSDVLEDRAAVNPAAETEEHIADFRVEGTFSGSPLRFQHHIIRAVRALMIARVSDIDLQRGGASLEDSGLIGLMVLGLSKRFETDARRGLRKSTLVLPTVEVFSPYDDQWSVNLHRFPVDQILSVKHSSTGEFSSDDAQGPSDLIASTDYDVVPRSGGHERLSVLRMRNRPFTDGVGSLQVRYVGGLAATTAGVPGDVRLACLRQVAYWHQRKGALGVSGESRAGHSANFYATADLLDDVKAVFRRYRRRIGAF